MDQGKGLLIKSSSYHLRNTFLSGWRKDAQSRLGTFSVLDARIWLYLGLLVSVASGYWLLWLFDRYYPWQILEIDANR